MAEAPARKELGRKSKTRAHEMTNAQNDECTKSPTTTDAKDSMMDLEQLREQISAVDSDIVTLLTKRLQLVEQVSDYKKEQSLPVLDQARERKVLERIAELAPEALKEQYLSLYALIMQIARIEDCLLYTSPSPRDS